MFSSYSRTKKAKPKQRDWKWALFHRNLNDMKETASGRSGKSTPGRGNKSKGFEVGISSVCSRNGREASVTRG